MAEMSVMEDLMRVPEARYAYYRRCQIFRRGGAQCKSPAEKGSHICYAHAGQLATAVRRERERRAVLVEAVTQMRRKVRPECEMADLFLDFKGIQITLTVIAQALIDGRVDCKTAGRLAVQLQTASKLLRILHRKGREGRQENRISPQICADERRLGRREENQNLTAEARRRGEIQKTLPRINAHSTDARKTGEKPRADRDGAANERAETRIALVQMVRAIADGRGWAHAPPEWLRAA